MKLSCVIITMGTRPTELERAIASTEPLRADGVELVLVGNGADLPAVPDDVRTKGGGSDARVLEPPGPGRRPGDGRDNGQPW